MERADVEQRTCPVCGTQFTPTTWNNKYCSGFRGQCYRRGVNHAQRLKEGRRTVALDAPLASEYDCRRCGKRCVPGSNVSPHASRFCGVTCKRLWHRDHKTRADAFDVEQERIDRLKVFARDDYRCQLCGEPTDKTAKWPDPKTPTLDHIVPISMGGPHLYSNVQCACWNCNQRKGRHLDDDQLAFAA